MITGKSLVKGSLIIVISNIVLKAMSFSFYYYTQST